MAAHWYPPAGSPIEGWGHAPHTTSSKHHYFRAAGDDNLFVSLCRRFVLSIVLEEGYELTTAQPGDPCATCSKRAAR